MKKFIQLLLILIVIILVGAGAWITANLKDIKAFLPMASAAYAKFMCSSLFVEGKTEEQAHNWSKLALPVQRCDIDYEKKTVTAKGLGKTSTARYVSERFGCTLE